MLSGIRKLCHRIFTKIITKKLQKTIAKILQKSYNMVTERARPFWIMKSFSSCFFGISGVCHPPPAVLLHSCRPTPHRRYSASCAKEPVWFRTGFFASKNPEKSAHSEGKYDLRSILGQFACFSAKDIYKVWRGRGLYSAWVCGKVYTINS